MSENVANLKKKIKALISFRAVLVTLLLGSAFLLKAGYEKFLHASAFSYLIVSLYILTIAYSLLVERIKHLFAFAYTQLILDVIFGIVLIYITGGIESWFSFILVLTVISSSIVLNKKAGYVVATLCSILYGVLINFQFLGLLSLSSRALFMGSEYLYNIFIHIISFYLTAYLSGYLSSRLEKTAKKLYEKDSNLRDLEFFNREVIESLPSGLFTTDKSGTILTFNRAAEDITGIRRDSVVGKRIEEVLPFFKFSTVGSRREETIEINGVQKVIGFQITAHKGIRGNDTGLIGIFQDLTGFKRLEAEMKQREKWAAIGELSSCIAHEIRNPLAPLRSSIEMLKEDAIPQSSRKRLMEIALKEMERLDRIIGDFLMYSRPKTPEFKKFDLHIILDETMELLSHTGRDRGDISISKNYSGSLEVVADPEKMRQVFWNLGVNAVDAMPESGVLTVSTRNTDKAVEIIFKDSGSGITQEDMERIFYPFFTTKENGTGLGLSIAYRMVEEHQGRIHVESNPGIGTTFEIVLPKRNGKT